MLWPIHKNVTIVLYTKSKSDKLKHKMKLGFKPGMFLLGVFSSKSAGRPLGRESGGGLLIELSGLSST